MRLPTASAVTVGVLALAAGPAGAATRIVDQAPGAPCKRPAPDAAANVHTAIQPAVEASRRGDTVLVCPGTYAERVTIARNAAGERLDGLRLLAVTTHLSTIAAPPGLTDDDAIVTVSEARGAEVRRFVIAGPSPTGVGAGVAVRDGATARVHTNRIVDVRDDPLGEDPSGAGIAFGSFDSATGVSTTGGGTALDNDIRGYQRNGILATEAGTSVALSRNTVTGAGPTAALAQAGIEVRFGARATILGARVSDNAYTGTDRSGDRAAGILAFLPGPGLTLATSRLTGNQAGLDLVDADGASIRANIVSGGESGIHNDASSEGNRFERNRISGHSITDCTDDSSGGFGTLGTSNTWTGNRGAIASPAGICTP